MDHITDITAFVHIVAQGSLSAAARELDLSLAVVSKRLLRLESALGVRLVHRNSRQLSLTAEGREFHHHSLALLEQVQRTEDAVALRRGGASGLLRVTASDAFTRRQIAPRLGRFLDLYPAVQVELMGTDETLDLVKEGIDVAIRQGMLADSGLVARCIALDRRVLCAAPAYIARHGLPQQPEDLAQHRCIVFGDPAIRNWTLVQGEVSHTLQVQAAVHAHAGDAAHAAALGGAGVVFKSEWEVADDIAAGRLVALLPGWGSAQRPIHAVYPSARHATPKVRCFIDFMVDALKAPASSPFG
ncbi:MAG: LysR family transcriptional regulator [Burkholderiales bacterium]|nr:LysR family transcriptional regulator [Burkholderiales bacterium]